MSLQIPATEKRVVSVAAALVVHGKQFLIAKRGKGRHLSDYWEFPGGKVEANEQPEQTCIRELKEELNCSISVERFFTNCRYDYDDFTLDMNVYLCHFVGEPFFEVLEHQEVKMIDVSQMDQYEFAPADVDFLPKIKELLA